MEVIAGSPSGEFAPVTAVRMTLSGKTFMPIAMRVQSWVYGVQVPYTAAVGWASRENLITWMRDISVAAQARPFIDQFGAVRTVYLLSVSYPQQVTPEQDGPRAIYSATLRLSERL